MGRYLLVATPGRDGFDHFQRQNEKIIQECSNQLPEYEQNAGIISKQSVINQSINYMNINKQGTVLMIYIYNGQTAENSYFRVKDLQHDQGQLISLSDKLIRGTNSQSRVEIIYQLKTQDKR